jgi:hypothetical protein
MKFTVFWYKFQVFSGTYILLPCVTVKMDTVISFETLLVFYQSKPFYFPIAIKFGVTW